MNYQEYQTMNDKAEQMVKEISDGNEDLKSLCVELGRFTKGQSYSMCYVKETGLAALYCRKGSSLWFRVSDEAEALRRAQGLYGE